MGEMVGTASPGREVTKSSPSVELLHPARERVERETIIIQKHRGFLWPITGAIGLVILGVSGLAIWNLMGESERLHRDHIDTQVHSDSSLTALLSSGRSRRMVKDDEVEFVLRRGADGPQRIIVARTAADAFVNMQLNYIDERRHALKDKTHRELIALFDQVFSDREPAVNAYADWFFAWGQSWSMLYQAVMGGINEVPKVGISRTKVTEAARIEVERYLMDHYKEFVLKPELRDPLITKGMERVLREAHQEFLFTLSSLDYRLTEFLKTHTRHIEPLTQTDQQRIKLDWDAQRWKMPRTQIDGQYQQALVDMATIAGSTLVLGPVLEATVLPLIGELVTETLTGFEWTIGGTLAGSEIPFIGNVAGLALGAVGDYALSQFRDRMNRAEFVIGNRAAIEATMREWKDKLSPELDKLIDIWMDDTQATIALEKRS